MDGGALTTTYEGLEGLRAGWRDFLGAFETISIHPETEIAAGRATASAWSSSCG